ncbi:hypothetical protein GCM10010446_00160 [Streptomyces enissocaesilis]|uniref:Oxo-4-hydroxy-4-carboxy-5-ureidoimidazoline decarboxylase domain-containing protein n=1 Tax=Streptomyces enissocaesilis TaxID=332589 RepID=A0ABP6J3U4_9ACTN
MSRLPHTFSPIPLFRLPPSRPSPPEGFTLCSESPGRTAIPQQHRGPATPVGLGRFNAAPAGAAEAALLACCAGPRWARHVAAHRPYPDLGSLLAAADEAAYDLSFDEISEAPSRESSAGPHEDAPAAAHTALRAAHAAYESSFGHAFAIRLDTFRPRNASTRCWPGSAPGWATHRTRSGRSPPTSCAGRRGDGSPVWPPIHGKLKFSCQTLTLPVRPAARSPSDSPSVAVWLPL